MTRKGMMVGYGKKGYHNLLCNDPKIHSDASKGVKQPQRLPPAILRHNAFKSSKGGKTISEIMQDTRNRGSKEIMDAAQRDDKWSYMGGMKKAYAQTLFGINNENEWEEFKTKKKNQSGGKYQPSPEGKKIQAKIDAEEYAGYRIGDLRKTFSKYEDKTHWKNPIDAIVPTRMEAEKLAKAITYFQGDVATIVPVSVPWQHPEGLVTMQRTVYQVKSKGYQA